MTYGADHPVVGRLMPLAGVRLVETRVLHRRAEGWVALPYVWNAEQTDAVLKRAGDLIETTLHHPDGRAEPLNYFVPNANQCAGCHATDNTTRAIRPIGLKARHLNKPSSFAPSANQLDVWRLNGLLTGEAEGQAPRNAVWTDEKEGLNARARLSRHQLLALPLRCRARRHLRPRPSPRDAHGSQGRLLQGHHRGRGRLGRAAL